MFVDEDDPDDTAADGDCVVGAAAGGVGVFVDKRPCNTASTCDEMSASIVAKLLRILLGNNTSVQAFVQDPVVLQP